MRRDEREAVATYLGSGASEPTPPRGGVLRRSHRQAREPAEGCSGTAGARATRTRVSRPRRGWASRPIRCARLELKWAFAFDGDVSAFAQPTVARSRSLFVGSAGRHRPRAEHRHRMPALDLPGERPGALGRFSPCRSDSATRCSSATSPAGSMRSRPRPASSSGRSASTIAKRRRLTGAPIVHDGVVFIPAASWEESRAIGPLMPVLHLSRQRRGAARARRIARLEGAHDPRRTEADGDQPRRHAAMGTVWRGRVGDSDDRRQTRPDRTSPPATTTRRPATQHERRRSWRSISRPAESCGRGR